MYSLQTWIVRHLPLPSPRGEGAKPTPYRQKYGARMNQETLGLIAGTLTTASFIPQVWKIWTTRSARDLSWAMVAVFTLGTFLWLLYGIKVGSMSIVVANAITFLLSLAICAMKLRFDKEIIGDPR